MFMLIISIIVILMILSVLIFPRLGHWLIVEDNLVESDIIVVLMGSVPDRLLEAVVLYQEGFAEQITMVDSHMVGYDVLLSKGVQIPKDAELSKTAANSLGVPNDDIIILHGNAKSTQDEAIIVRGYLRDNKDINSMILVTSKYHSARAKNIFTKALDGLERDVLVTSSPSRYDSFDAEHWWKNREDAKHVAIEYLKLFNFYVREQFQL
ncbi:MAG TPA: YdcF family protein [Clostridiales bacterium]|nr:YdcF family protein [Clostridiales bacterium]